MPTAGWWEALFPDPAGIVRALGISPGMTVIDLCSGDGWFTLPIARIVKRVFAIDIDGALLNVSRLRQWENGITNVEHIEGEAFDLVSLVRAPVDLVFMANSFHGVPERSRLAREIRIALVPEGRLSVLNWHARPREETTVLGEPRGPKTELRLSPDQTALAVEAGGLSRMGVIEVPPYHYGALFARPRSE